MKSNLQGPCLPRDAPESLRGKPRRFQEERGHPCVHVPADSAAQGRDTLSLYLQDAVVVTREDNCNQTAENNCWQESPYLEQTLQRLARWPSAALA